MNKWKISELAKLTGVSVRTLHYYDHIGLLKSSERQPNEFRIYGKNELQIFLQVLSLKSLGFELSVIKDLLDKSITAHEHFLIQKKLLDEKIATLTRSSKILGDMVSIPNPAPLDLILKLISMYHLSNQLEKTPVRKLLPQTLLKKSTDYKERICAILLQVGIISNDDLLGLCTQLLEELTS